MTKQQGLAIVAVSVVVVALVVYELWSKTVAAPAVSEIPEGTHSITLTKDGYVPATIVLAAGDTVTFRNETGDLYWPASDLHPSHRDYPAFDPKQPIQPNETWSFTFTEAGTWGFHDHLAPYYTGTITVTD